MREEASASGLRSDSKLFADFGLVQGRKESRALDEIMQVVDRS
jgi:hypothetical protein